MMTNQSVEINMMAVGGAAKERGKNNKTTNMKSAHSTHAWGNSKMEKYIYINILIRYSSL